jgi:hypothetical protein
VSDEDLGAYEAAIEFGLVQEYRDVIALFSHIIETERRFYLANDVSVTVHEAAHPALIELNLKDAWVWDMYRPARFVPEVRVLTTKDVNIERLPESVIPELPEA